MLLKLACRNVRRSVRDYTIYFVTLLLGVALFYAFNSIGSQQVVFDLEDSATNEAMFQTTQVMMSLFSGVVAFVLGFLVIYANQMLIRRRKHEFGIYLTLGMSPVSVSAIVLIETIVIGIVAFVIGIVCGVVLSQLLCFATAALFELMITDYTFVFSEASLLVTALCFAGIFAVVAILNLVIVNRFKLIDLLYASERNQRYSVRNPWVCFAAFVLSLVIIGAAYLKLQESGVLAPDTGFYISAGLMLVGTLLLFWSLAGFVVGLLTSSKRVYLRGLVPFTVRQVASKVNTAFLSLWAVCVLLFFALTTFSTGLALVDAFTTGIKEATPCDVTVNASMYVDQEASRWDDAAQFEESNRLFEEKFPDAWSRGVNNDWDIAKDLESRMPEWEDLVADAVQVDRWYVPGVTYGSLVSDTNALATAMSMDVASLDMDVMAVGRSQVDALLALLGQPALGGADDEAVLLNNVDALDEVASMLIKDNDALEFAGHRVALARESKRIQLANSFMQDTTLIFAVPDTVIQSLKSENILPMHSDLDIDLRNGSEDDRAFSLALAKAFPVDEDGTYTMNGVDVSDIVFASSPWPATNTITRTEMIDQARGFRMMVTYLALYIGLVFLVSIAAILAIQQLSVAIDSQGRYRLLWKLGCDTPMLSRSLFMQILVYFLLPLAVATCHSVCAVSVIYNEMSGFVSSGFYSSILMALLLLIAIYGGYLLITFILSRTIMKDAMRAG